MTLTFDHLSKRCGRTIVLDDVSFAAQPGPVAASFGPNVAGMSSAMEMLLDGAMPTARSASIAVPRYRDLPDPGGR